MSFDGMQLFARLGFIQFRIRPGDPEENLGQVTAALASIDCSENSLIVLPELWASGFVYDRLEVMAEETEAILAELAGLAGRHNCVLAGSLPEKIAGRSGGLLYNTLFITGPGGILGKYRKQQIFAYGGEARAFVGGMSPIPVATQSGRIGCLVCYDLRFPELAMRQSRQGADLLICSAEWPRSRIGNWRILLKARAIENQTFLVACNGCGMVGDMELGGRSAIIDPQGRILAEAGDDPQAVVVTPDWQSREDFRSRFRAFAVSSYPFRDEDKILPSAAACLDLLRLRRQVGQRVVCCEVSGPFRLELLTSLEDARRTGDFLMLAWHAEGGGDENLRFFAALGCVDAVCRLDLFGRQERALLSTLASLITLDR